MAFTSTIPAQASYTNPLLRGINTVFNSLISISEANSRSQEVSRLSALSDEHLYARGLRREDIVRHVFRDVLWS